MKTLMIIGLVSMLTQIPAETPEVTAATDSKGCPPEHRNARVRVGNLLGSPLLPEVRARFDLGTASPEDVQLLRNPHDRATCDLLWRALEAEGPELAPGDAVTFFRSGDSYFVPIARRSQAPAGIVRLDGRSSLLVYDAGFRLVGQFGA